MAAKEPRGFAKLDWVPSDCRTKATSHFEKFRGFKLDHAKVKIATIVYLAALIGLRDLTGADSRSRLCDRSTNLIGIKFSG